MRLAKTGFALALVLAGCSDNQLKSEFSDAERDEIGDIAGDAAGDAIADDDKIRELEGRIDDLERRLN